MQSFNKSELTNTIQAFWKEVVPSMYNFWMFLTRWRLLNSGVLDWILELLLILMLCYGLVETCRDGGEESELGAWERQLLTWENSVKKFSDSSDFPLAYQKPGVIALKRFVGPTNFFVFVWENGELMDWTEPNRWGFICFLIINDLATNILSLQIWRGVFAWGCPLLFLMNITYSCPAVQIFQLNIPDLLKN